MYSIKGIAGLNKYGAQKLQERHPARRRNLAGKREAGAEKVSLEVSLVCKERST